MKQSWEAPNDFQKTSPGSFSVFWFPARDVNEITYECDHIQRNYLKTNQPHCLNSLRKLLKLNHFFFCFSPLPCSQLSKLQTILRHKRKEICFVLFDHYSETDIGDPFDQPHHHHHHHIWRLHLLLIILLFVRQQNGDHDSNRIDWLFQHWWS